MTKNCLKVAFCFDEGWKVLPFTSLHFFQFKAIEKWRTDIEKFEILHA